MKQLKIGIVMDAVETIHPKKDSSLALMLEAQSRGHVLVYFKLQDIGLKNERAYGNGKSITVFKDETCWFKTEEASHIWLEELDVILMRKDPPFSVEFIMSTYILEKAHELGCLVINNPQSLRDVNEKVFTSKFPQCCPETIISQSQSEIKNFIQKHEKVVVKPTDKMGGQSIFVIEKKDLNTNVILEELTRNGAKYVQVQTYIPEIKKGGRCRRRSREISHCRRSWRRRCWWFPAPASKKTPVRTLYLQPSRLLFRYQRIQCTKV